MAIHDGQGFAKPLAFSIGKTVVKSALVLPLNHQLYYSQGFKDGSDYGGDSVDPTVSIIALPVVNTDPLVVQIYDNEGLTHYQVTCQERQDGERYVVYDPEFGFAHPYSGRSSVSGSGTEADPYVFTIYRRGRWPTGVEIDIRVRAVDTSGNVDTADDIDPE